MDVFKANKWIPNQSFISGVEEFVNLHLVDQKAVTVITLDVHVIRRSARIRISLR